MLSLKKAYPELLAAERRDSILTKIYSKIIEGNWPSAGAAIDLARKEKIPEESIQSAIHRAFEVRIGLSDEKQKESPK